MTDKIINGLYNRDITFAKLDGVMMNIIITASTFNNMTPDEVYRHTFESFDFLIKEAHPSKLIKNTQYI